MKPDFEHALKHHRLLNAIEVAAETGTVQKLTVDAGMHCPLTLSTVEGLMVHHERVLLKGYTASPLGVVAM